MLKHILTAATLIALVSSAIGAGHAASLQRLSVSGTDFDIILATANAGADYQLDRSPDALIMHLTGDMVLAFEDANAMLDTFDALRNARGSFAVTQAGAPAAIYVLQKGAGVAALK